MIRERTTWKGVEAEKEGTAKEFIEHKNKNDMREALNRQLIEALERGDDKRAIELIAKGASPYAKYANNVNALMCAVRYAGSKSCLTLIKESSKFEDTTNYVNCMDRYGWTALHYAVVCGREEMVELLLQNKANINLTNGMGMTPLMCAALNGKANMIRLLLEKGADPIIKDRLGLTALEIARRKGHNDVVAVLEEWLRNNGHQ